MKSLVTKVLQRAKISDEHLAIFTSPPALHEYQKVFTYDSQGTWLGEFYEWMGDIYLNMTASQYEKRRYPSIQLTAWVTAITHQYLKKQTLAKVAEMLGFPSQLRPPPSLQQQMQRDETVRMSTYEDMVEAFVGCTVKIASYHWLPATAYMVAQAMIVSWYDDLTIDISYRHLFSPLERLKLVIDSQKSYDQNWDFKKLLHRQHKTADVRSDVIGMTLRVPRLRRDLVASTVSRSDNFGARKYLYRTAVASLQRRNIRLSTSTDDLSDEEILVALYQEQGWPALSSLITVLPQRGQVELKLYAPLHAYVPGTEVLFQVDTRREDPMPHFEKAIETLAYRWGIQLQPPNPYAIPSENPDVATVLPFDADFQAWYANLLLATPLLPDVQARVLQTSLVECRQALSSPSYHNRYNWTRWVNRGKYLFHVLIMRMIRIHHHLELSVKRLTDIVHYMNSHLVDEVLAHKLGLKPMILTQSWDPKYLRHALYAVLMVVYDAIEQQTQEAVAMYTLEEWIVPRLKDASPSLAVMTTNINSLLGQHYMKYKVGLKKRLIQELLDNDEIRLTLYRPDSESILTQRQGPTSDVARLRVEIYDEAAKLLGLIS